MAFVVWAEKHSVGVAAIDAEHGILVGLIDKLYAKLFDGTGETLLESIIDELVDYMDMHFRNEETLFAQSQYPRLAQHKAQHDEMRRRVSAYREDLRRGYTASLAADMLHCLKEWMTKHVLLSDKEACAFLNAKGFR
jgi:hemerythrin-like metal-binding protein